MTPLGIGECRRCPTEALHYDPILTSEGVRRTWKRLLDSQCGIVSIKDRSPQFAALPSQIAGVVPEGKKEDGKWNASEYLQPGVQAQSHVNTQHTLTTERMHGAWPVLRNMQWLHPKRH